MGFLPLTALLCGLCAARARAVQPIADSYKGPIHAQLLKYLNVRQVQPGASVFVRVSEDWSGLNCSLRKGAVIEARVEKAARRVKGAQPSELALSFSKAQCSGAEMAPLDLILSAVSYVPAADQASGGQFPVVRYMATPGIHSMGRGATTGANLPPIAASDEETIFTKGAEFTGMNRGNARHNLKAGEVYGIKGMEMQVGAGPNHSSILIAKKRDVELDEDTEFVLVPTGLTSTASVPTFESSIGGAAEATDIAETLKETPSAPIAAEEFAVCAPPSCTTDLPPATEQVVGHPDESIPARPLGYAPRPQKIISELDNDQAMAWLGPDRLLVAFNPHKLIYREGISTADAPLRTIRAVLVDTRAKRMVSTADWELSDSGKFLWQIAGDCILAHVGKELRVYDAHLHPLTRLRLGGPLDFVRISPNGEVIAVAVLKERHTPQLHAKLRESLEHEPQEDVEVQILDRYFKVIAHTSSASDVIPPTLLNEGQLTLRAQANHRYRLALLKWAGQERTLARFSSACTPELSTFAPDLVLVRTCDRNFDAAEVRVLHANGAVVMRRGPNLEELGYEAKGNPTSGSFALKVLHSSEVLPQGTRFQALDLSSVELRVYRATDGKPLAAIRTDAPPPSHDGYSLSPDGAQIAVLADGQIEIYPVRAK